MSEPSPDEIIRKLDSEISEINTNLMDTVKSRPMKKRKVLPGFLKRTPIP